MEKVDVYVEVSGDYCAFHELSLSVVYDITNNIQLGDETLEELENWDFDGDYCDYEIFKAIKDGNDYYVLI
jgi:hypothetical protein